MWAIGIELLPIGIRFRFQKLNSDQWTVLALDRPDSLHLSFQFDLYQLRISFYLRFEFFCTEIFRITRIRDCSHYQFRTVMLLNNCYIVWLWRMIIKLKNRHPGPFILWSRVTGMLVTSLCWWLYDGDWFEILVTESLCWWFFSLC